MSNNTPTEQMIKKKPSQEGFAQADSETPQFNTEDLGRLLPGSNEHRRAGKRREFISNICALLQFISTPYTASVGQPIFSAF